MVHDDTYLVKYYKKCKSGEITVGVELQTMLDKLIEDLSNPHYYYDTTDAFVRMFFMEKCIKLTKSPFYGKPMRLMLWQKAWIECLYSFKMADTGLDRFKKTLLLISRKNTKSELSSALSLSEMFVGEDGSDIVCSSNDDNQANILYEAIDTMRLMIDPNQKYTWKNQRCIRNKATNSKIFKLSDRTRNKEGRNIDFAIIDEKHEMKTAVIEKSIEQSQSLKKNPKLIGITTEGFTNEGLLDEELKYARKVIFGEEDGLAAERYLPWLYTQDSEAEIWQDRNTWVKSNPSLGIVKKWEYLDEQIDKARISKADRMFVCAKDFNIKMSNSQAWLIEEDYNYPCAFDIKDFKGSICLGAVDLAETTDMACAKILLMKRNKPEKYIYTMYFIPESKIVKKQKEDGTANKTSDDKSAGAKYGEWAKKGILTISPGNEVDSSTVAEWFKALCEKYKLELYMCGYDQRYSKDFLKCMTEGYGLDCELINQNAYTMSTAIKLVEADLKDRIIYYNNNEIDKWCFGNASIKVDNYGNVMLVKIDRQRARRIDGAVTTAILMETYRRYKSEINDTWKKK